MSWDKRFVVSEWEKERDTPIARVMSHHNSFVTGQASWTLDRKPGLACIIKRDKTVKELFPDLQEACASNSVVEEEIEPIDPTRTDEMVMPHAAQAPILCQRSARPTTRSRPVSGWPIERSERHSLMVSRRMWSVGKTVPKV
ncbi:hypothetical protein GCM10009425_49100 [Pseudomonas asuensis]|uniref:Uncharacterized protein n=2 Tax=Pseudomonas asuensis TaxID=1825787 RepID=A0ABQ2H596_9PSED|nr:hypothetical protein GCM10009425_49100 [Pseudomonas asuensis]